MLFILFYRFWLQSRRGIQSSQQCRGEKDEFYNNLSSLKYNQFNNLGIFIQYLISPGFLCVLIFYSYEKNIGFAIKFSKISLHLLLMGSFLTQLCISLQFIHLSVEAEVIA